LSLFYRGKELREDLKTLKDCGMNSLQADGSVAPVKLVLSTKNIFELEQESYAKPAEPQYSDQVLLENVDTLKMFLGDLPCSEEVVKLALKKCKLNLEEVMLMVTEPDRVNDLEEEIKREQEVNDNL
jgi:hypothetical protein